MTRIKILKYDLEDCDSAVSTGERTKPAENSAVLSGVLGAVSTGEQSSERMVAELSHWAPPARSVVAYLLSRVAAAFFDLVIHM